MESTMSFGLRALRLRDEPTSHHDLLFNYSAVTTLQEICLARRHARFEEMHPGYILTSHVRLRQRTFVT
jgi:hypothetical protein